MSDHTRSHGRHGNGGRGRGRDRHFHRDKTRDQANSCPTLSADELNSPVVLMFQEFATRLDSKHDRYERLVKLSRDVTIESKRIIFMLHRITEEEGRQELLEQAAQRFRHLENTAMKQMATELSGQDPYLYMRAISPGLQEYIEALSYYHYLLREDLISWAEAQARLTYPAPCGDGGATNTSGGERTKHDDSLPDSEETKKAEDERAAVEEEKVQVEDMSQAGAKEQVLRLLLPYHEYVLGLADLTGELMRRCINSVSSGQLEHCWKLCAVLRAFQEGFINIGNTGPRELTRKLSTLRQSVNKVENACYQLKVRGEEIPQHMLADVFSSHDDFHHDDDVGD